VPLLTIAIRLALSLAVLFPAGIIIWQLMTGAIRTNGLFNEKGRDGRASISPARVQLLATTLIASAVYVQRVVAARGGCELPDLPHELLPFLGASHLTYMVGKAWAVVGQTLTNSPRRNQ
jgi:hypothetical protein